MLSYGCYLWNKTLEPVVKDLFKDIPRKKVYKPDETNNIVSA